MVVCGLFNDFLVAFVNTLTSFPLAPLLFGIVGFGCCLCVFKFFCDLVYFDSPRLFFVIPSSKSAPFKFADKYLIDSGLKQVFNSILDRDLDYFKVWYSPNKKDIKKFKKTALLSLKCLLLELFYFESDLEAISSFYESESFDVVLFSTVLGEHPDLKYYHDLPVFFRTLVNDKEKILLLKEQILNEKK